MLFFVLQRVRNLYEDSNLFNFFGKVYLIESPEGFKVFFCFVTEISVVQLLPDSHVHHEKHLIAS